MFLSTQFEFKDINVINRYKKWKWKWKNLHGILIIDYNWEELALYSLHQEFFTIFSRKVLVGPSIHITILCKYWVESEILTLPTSTTSEKQKKHRERENIKMSANLI